MEEELVFNEPEELVEEVIEEKPIEETTEEFITDKKSSISKETALKVVASTITTAKQSVSGTDSGSSVGAQGGTSTTASNMSSSSGGISTSSSPSISDQFASSTAQNNQVLNMSATVSSSTGTQTDTVETTSIAVDTTSTQTIQSQIDISMPTNSTDTETEQLVEDVIAQNMQAAQEDVIAKQEETGEYGSEDLVISYIGFVPGFNTYRAVSIPEKEFWYEPKNIYTNNRLLDNTAAFYELAGQSITTLTNLKEMQPNL